VSETFKIVLLCVVAAIAYGIVHDQITARVCLEYFTVFHPPVFATRSPTLLALGWGVLATWWVGVFLGVPLALTARAGSRPPLSAPQLVRPVVTLLAVMACCALAAGSTGFFLAKRGLVSQPEWTIPALAQSAYPRFVADWCAHSASYASGFLGGIVLCIVQYRRRIVLSRSFGVDS
jgi:hypothetical protein